MFRTHLLVALGCWISVSHSVASADDEAPPTNVIIIYADDLGWGDLACYGHQTFKTPHLDRMAKEGARLTNFYSSCPYCAPSRASLLTGRYPFRCGMFSNPCPYDDPANSGRNAMARHKMHLPVSEVTLAQLFKKAGYATSWHFPRRPLRFRRTTTADEGHAATGDDAFF